MTPLDPTRPPTAIRPGTAADLGAIARIQQDAPSSWRPGEFLAYRLDVLTAFVQNEANPNEAIAFAASRQVAPGEQELLEVAVHPAFRRQGYGEQLLRHLLGHYPGAWFLEVRASNAAAQYLYQKLGFTAAGKRPGYYWNQALGKSEEGIVFHRMA